jgi:O-antigen/teichoic acid export membrane protein
LGKFLSLEVFGIYIIGFFLGSFPMMLGTTVSRKLLIPVYRDRPPSESRDNFLKLRKLRVMITLGVFSLLGVMAFFGPWLVAFLYDDRYLSAGAIVVLIACCGFAQAIGMTYDAAALAGGDSKAYFLFSFIRAALTIAGLLTGISVAGLVGALAGQFLATLAVYPALVWLSVKFGVWDKLHDAAFALIGLLICAIALLLHWPEILMLAAG